MNKTSHPNPKLLYNTFKTNKNNSDINSEIQIKDNIVKPTKKRANNNSESLLVISYDNFMHKKIVLDKYKLTQLKPAAKAYKLRTSGKKLELIERITTFFNKTKSAIYIQRIFRSWICRYIIQLRGPGLRNRKLCVNDTDFSTMEPLTEIDNDYFYSYNDVNNFTYGFNITSLIEWFKRNNTTNPYNRETLPDNIVKNIISLYSLSFILCVDFSKMNL